MKQIRVVVMAVVLGTVATIAVAQVRTFVPVTDAMLASPSPDDWLMYSRTYDAQRFSPLNQITRQNVGQLKTAWTKVTPTGTFEGIPIVYRGVLYMMVPGAAVWALDATSGNLLWEYKRDTTAASRTKTLAIYDDLVFYAAPDGYLVALDATTGKVRWETKTDGGMTSGPIVVEGRVLTGRTCVGQRANCYIAAHDGKTGKEAWRFYTAAGHDDPGGATWGGSPESTRSASTWGLPGTYDPARRVVYWGILRTRAWIATAAISTPLHARRRPTCTAIRRWR